MRTPRWTPGLAIAVAFALGAVARAGDKPTMEHLWAELEKKDWDATVAVLAMADRPDEAVAFLKTVLKPLTITPQGVMDLIVKLESKDEKVWKPAFEGLEYFDPRLGIKLEELMADVTLVPARQRMVEVLSGRDAGSMKEEDVSLSQVGDDGFNFRSGNGSWWAEHKVSRIGGYSWSDPKKKWTRAVRAIALLEHIGTPDALAILKAMATGHPDAHPTKAAKAAVAMREARTR